MIFVNGGIVAHGLGGIAALGSGWPPRLASAHRRGVTGVRNRAGIRIRAGICIRAGVGDSERGEGETKAKGRRRGDEGVRPRDGMLHPHAGATHLPQDGRSASSLCRSMTPDGCRGPFRPLFWMQVSGQQSTVGMTDMLKRARPRPPLSGVETETE